MKRKQASTLFLKIVVFLLGTIVLVLCIFGLPTIALRVAGTDFARLLYPVFIVMYIAAVPFFVALYHTLKILNYIDANKAFSELTVKALKMIKRCAIAVCTIYVVGMPFFYLLAEQDDAPGVILIGLVFVFASGVIAIIAAVLQRILQEAIDIKKENDLTV